MTRESHEKVFSTLPGYLKHSLSIHNGGFTQELAYSYYSPKGSRIHIQNHILTYNLK